MKERPVNGKRAVVAHHQSAEIPEPRDRAFHRPPPPIAPQRPAVLRRGLATIPAMRNDQLDAALGQLLAQRVAIVPSVGDDSFRLLPGTTWLMPPSYADRPECRLCEPDLRPGSRVKVVSQRNTRAVDHHHPLRPLAPLGFADSAALFSRERNCRPRTIRSTLTAAVHSTRPERHARS